ncbi:TIGR01777 family protein [Salibacterium salarium]|uniref:TIGR01777 family protein n=1 Tax=Salibacterium salarium TaxID=284579 RepID=A0A3R9P701_9BACI|nr:TIGR01777 family oxidoreductase [Salibacterium salarium]RSL31628.1 TIGR01777 family protein [Salibacterium salarium]
MNIAITGGTGLVGSTLTGYLTQQGHHVYILTRNSKNQQNKANITFVQWLDKGLYPEKELPNIDAVVNLAGASINKRWTAKHKQAILHSRIRATKEVTRIIQEMESPPDVLINASAVGYYGVSNQTTFTEATPPQNRDFLQDVCERWEKEASKVEKMGVRTVYARFGLILDKKEGALPKIMLPYKLFAGGPIGSGKQWYSWIHLRDVIEMIVFAICHEEVKGALNVTAPNPERMKDFGKKLGNAMNRPHWAPVPAFLLRNALGDMSLLVLKGQRVLPEKMMSHGYGFSYPALDEALTDLVQP